MAATESRRTVSRSKPAATPAGGGGARESDRRVKHVALIMDHAMSPRRRLIRGVARYVQEHEPWAIYLTPAGVEKSLTSWLRNWNGDGLIVYANDPDAAALLESKLPVVDLFGKLVSESVPLVHADDRTIGRLGAEHLLERGFQHFGFWEYTHPDTEWSIQRRVGFEQAVTAAGFTCDVYRSAFPKPGSGGPETWERQQHDLTAWLTRLAKPAGVMTSTDLSGQQLLEACLRAGVHVPEEIAVVGADNDELVCRIAIPPLSSVIINDEQRGYEAAALLDRLMAGEPAPKGPVLIEPVGVVTRASTDIMAIDDPAVSQAMRYLREHAAEDIGIDDVARAVAVSRTVLVRRFRRLVGRSIHQEIIRQRLNHAIQLLGETQLELKVIARKAGFGSQAYMNAVFQEKLGKTPGSFRNHLRTSGNDGAEADEESET
jgi:LacI family transcriptional regulator